MVKINIILVAIISPCSHGDDEPIDEEEFPPQSVNFAKLLLVR